MGYLSARTQLTNSVFQRFLNAPARTMSKECSESERRLKWNMAVVSELADPLQSSLTTRQSRCSRVVEASALESCSET